MTSDEIEISDDVLRAAWDSLRATPKSLAVSQEALRNACIVAIKADRKSDARVKHLKRGTTYRVIGDATVQTDEPLRDNDRVVIYQCENDGSIWVRRYSEFHDGRFRAVPKIEISKEWCERAAAIEAEHGDQDCSAGAPRPPMPEDVAGLCERLRDGIWQTEDNRSPWTQDIIAAASALEAQAAEIERLESSLTTAKQALTPFSECAPAAPASILPNDAIADRQLTFGDLRRARAALDAINKECE